MCMSTCGLRRPECARARNLRDGGGDGPAPANERSDKTAGCGNCPRTPVMKATASSDCGSSSSEDESTGRSTTKSRSGGAASSARGASSAFSLTPSMVGASATPISPASHVSEATKGSQGASGEDHSDMWALIYVSSSGFNADHLTLTACRTRPRW